MLQFTSGAGQDYEEVTKCPESQTQEMEVNPVMEGADLELSTVSTSQESENDLTLSSGYQSLTNQSMEWQQKCDELDAYLDTIKPEEMFADSLEDRFDGMFKELAEVNSELADIRSRLNHLTQCPVTNWAQASVDQSQSDATEVK